MDQLWVAVVTTVCTVFASLLVTFIFNKVAGLPKELKKQRETERMEREKHLAEDAERDRRIKVLEDAVNKYPAYREQSLQIQQQLKQSDVNILDVCNAIKEDVVANRQMLDERLKSLERREKNALREKILDLYRKFTDDVLNPMEAWTDMERHAFFELVKDYESLGGNDYVHKVILPAMNKLDVVSMEHLDAVKELYDSRNAKHFKKPTKKIQTEDK